MICLSDSKHADLPARRGEREVNHEKEIRYIQKGAWIYYNIFLRRH